jgi:outer membrane receptor protein involved in Fe transport
VEKRRQRLAVNLKSTWAGGRRYVPIDLKRSRILATQIYDWQAAFEPKMPDYFRLDFQIRYRLNMPIWDIEWKIDVQNVTDHRNASYAKVGILPLFGYRVKF